jgi:serine/threonine-protein kinase
VFAELQCGEAGVEGTPFGRYRLIELLGRGGMGEVWRAYDARTDMPVALKVLPAHISQDWAFNKRFLRNMSLLARVGNPHVIQIHDFGEIDSSLYVDMQLIDGRDLEGVLAEERLLHPARAVGYIEQVAEALHDIHSKGLLHGDVKPSNIFITRRDFVYLSYLYVERHAAEQELMSAGGSFAYVAPEHFTNAAVDWRSDIYALACVLHQALTGQRPFPGDRVEQQISGHITTPPPRPSALQPEVPELLDAVIARGMAKDPDQRYASAVDFARAARDALPVAPA